jgi:competence protein ComEC
VARADAFISYFARALSAERSRFVLWSPVALMIGISAYFTLTDEPPIWLGPRALCAAAFFLWLTYRRPLRWIALPLLLITLGFTAAQLRAHFVVATPLLTEELTNVTLYGTIDEIDPVEKRVKLVLSQLNIPGLLPQDTPDRVRVSFRNTDSDLSVGDRIRLTANLYPLPSPIMPGSYDFARHFYFRRIGGNGFAMRAPEIIRDNDQPGILQWLNNLRHVIGDTMRAGMQGDAGTVSAAMTIGETGPIAIPAQNELRNSGLAHMLSISGLHLSIVAGIVFFNVRLLLTLYPPLALRLPVKKIAAFFGLTGAFIYLLLAGCPVPAQRAFIMVAFLFTAILLDRRGITLRSLTLAACFILIILPESMFGASFQMSFAATLAIVSLYESYGRALSAPGASFPRRAWHHLLGIVITSLAATLATAPFVVYNFNRFAIFGLISNMVVIPLATFIIMPGMVLALLLMPFGLQWIGYLPLQLGTNIMLVMAKWVTNLPYASPHLPSPTDFGLLIACFGLLWLCLMRERWRFAGLLGIAIGFATIAQHQPIDVFIGDDARQVMVRLPDGHYTALRGTNRSFTIQNWLRTEGEEDLVPLKTSGIDCDKSLCTYRKNNLTLTFLRKPDDDDALEQACDTQTDILVAWRTLHRETCPGPKQLIGRAELEAYGAHTLRLSPDGIHTERTREAGQGLRIWQPPRTPASQDDE